MCINTWINVWIDYVDRNSKTGSAQVWENAISSGYWHFEMGASVDGSMVAGADTLAALADKLQARYGLQSAVVRNPDNIDEKAWNVK